MKKKPLEFFNCNPTDKMILFGYLTNMDQRIDDELDLFDNEEKFAANADETFADYFINEAEKLFKKNGYFRYQSTKVQIDDLRKRIKDYNFWCAFMRTLQFSALVFSAGEVRDIVQNGVVHIRKNIGGGREGGIKSTIVRKEKAKSNYEIWQAEADKIWQENSNLSNSRVAELIAKKIGGKADTIRKYIKKPTP